MLPSRSRTPVVLEALFELGHEMRSDICPGQVVATTILEVLLNPFELIGLAPAE
ncbi:hypothetical protein [Natronorubrum aibiense]|uniref:hypothetical protein n=1 Tax=Natronorubrum aibiense TaxID=348826 RepID=UPI00128F7EA5|nr:hypothetical protein [Natronorubrum aibiense]